MLIDPALASELMESWEFQQNSHIRFRENRFRVMFDLLEEAFGDSINALDVACGPGSLSRRMLDRFPHSQTTSVDYDPVLLAIGKTFLRTYSDRITWIEGDLRADKWSGGLQAGSYNCALSTTALHWIDAQHLKMLYTNLYELLSDDGIFMNGDHMLLEENDSKILELAQRASERWSQRSFEDTGSMDWDSWWSYIRDKTELADLMEERSRRYASPGNHNHRVPLKRHIEFLKSAGFRNVDVVWQYSSDRILVAMK